MSWDYEAHPGDCCPEIVDGAWTVCCRECASTGVFPVPWIQTAEEGRGRDDASCTACKGTGRSVVAVADAEASDLGVRGLRSSLERAPESEEGGATGHAPGLPGAAEERVLARPHAAGTTVVVWSGSAVDRDTGWWMRELYLRDGVSPRDVIECPVIRASLPCRTCNHNSCGRCPECHPGLPEWSG